MVAFFFSELTGPVTGSKSVAMRKQAGETITSSSLFQPEVPLGLVSPQTRLPDPLRES